MINNSLSTETESSSLNNRSVDTIGESKTFFDSHKALAVSITASSLAACGGGGGAEQASSSANTVLSNSSASASLGKPSTTESSRFLQQAGLSASTEEVSELINKGYERWLEDQFKLEHESAWDWLIANGFNHNDYKFSNNPAHYVVWQQLFNAKDMLRKRVALALSEIMVIATRELSIAYRSFATAAYWDLLNNHAFGNYRELIEAVSLSPAMGVYLNTKGNRKHDEKTGRAPDENYAREVMQLFSIGLYELNLDGTVKTDGAGQPIETYGQEDIINLARVFTGWDLDKRTDINAIPPEYTRQPMIMNEQYHSTLAVNFLDGSIPAFTDGRAAISMAMDILFDHANIAPFVSKQLIQRLVTSNPSPAYVERVAKKFNDNGLGVRGDLQTVIKAILLDEEAREDWQSKPQSCGKLKEPMLRYVQWARTFKASSYSGQYKISSLSSSDKYLGQSPFDSPSVFNFFRPGYVPPGTALADQSLVAPELQLVNVITSASYLNYMMKVIDRGSGHWHAEIKQHDLTSKYVTELKLVNDVPTLLNQLNVQLAAGQIDAATINKLIAAVESIDTDSEGWELRRVKASIGLIMAAPEYLVLK